MKIETSCDSTCLSATTWSAYFDPEGPIGHGTTEAEAIAELFEAMAEDDDFALTLAQCFIDARPVTNTEPLNQRADPGCPHCKGYGSVFDSSPMGSHVCPVCKGGAKWFPVEAELKELRSAALAARLATGDATRDAERYQWMRRNHYVVREVTTQTGPNTVRSDGWLTSWHSVHDEPFSSMDAAVDNAMRHIP